MREKMPSSPKAKIDKPSWGLLAFLAIVIWGAFMMALLFLIPRIEHGSEFTGQLGDSFGIINSLLSALALAGIYLTYRSQKDQLDHTKSESEQRTTEDRFFRMLEAHQSLVNSLVHIQLGVEYTGKIALLREYERLIAFNLLSHLDNLDYIERKYGNGFIGQIHPTFKLYKSKFMRTLRIENPTFFEREFIPLALQEKRDPGIPSESDQQNDAFIKFYEESKPRISHYFKSCLALIALIKACKQKDDQKLYFNIFQSQLSPQEQALLFYYNRFKATPDEKTIFENSGLFQDVSSSDLIHPSHTNSPPPPQAGEGTFEVTP